MTPEKPFICHGVDANGRNQMVFEMWRDGDEFEVWVYGEEGKGEGMTITAQDAKALELWIEPRAVPPDVIVADQERGM